jgi:hypothetical protein
MEGLTEEERLGGDLLSTGGDGGWWPDSADLVAMAGGSPTRPVVMTGVSPT